MTTVWKVQLQIATVQEIEIPAGAELLCAREQGENIMVWFRCDPDAAKESRTIAICGTGHVAPPQNEARYIGTASLLRGTLMFHVFERMKEKGIVP